MALYESKNLEGNPNDPIMISPKGVKVQVPENMVSDLLKKKFTLVNKNWKPTAAKDAPVFSTQPIFRPKEEVESTLEVIEL